jgi:hypothetical protein
MEARQLLAPANFGQEIRIGALLVATANARGPYAAPLEASTPDGAGR